MEKSQAEIAWKENSNVICPYCENHVYEDESTEYFDEIWHFMCAAADKRENLIAESISADY